LFFKFFSAKTHVERELFVDIGGIAIGADRLADAGPE
jgi:hypothetical protein